MSFTSYSQINQLEETPLIAVSNFTFYFTLYQSDGVNRLNLTGATVYWVLCPYGQFTYTALQKTATITDATNGECNVALVPANTINLTPGKYVQQPVVYGGATNIYRPAQGTVLLLDPITVTIP